MVDEAVLGYLDDRLKIIEELNPEVLVLGPDPWNKDAIEHEIREKGLQIDVIQIEHVYSRSKFFKTGQIIEYIKHKYPLN